MSTAAGRYVVVQDSYFHFAYPDITVHRPVAHEAVKRALKTGRLVFFKAEMPHPRKAITAEQAVQQVLRFASRYQHDQAYQTQTAANEMQAAAGLVTVLG